MPSAAARSPFRRHAPRLSIENAAADEAKIMLYDEIGYFGVTAKDFISALDETSARTIHLHINSPGGDVFEGLAIANAIRDTSARVITHVDALAASIASVIACAGDYVRMADNAFFMMHNPYMLAVGNAADLRKSADLLDKVGGSIVSEYVKKSGLPVASVQSLMDDETWMTAQEAKDNGFVNAIDNESDAAESDGVFDLSIYRKTPAALRRERRSEPTIRELEAAVRDAGFSRSRAKQLVAAGLRSLDRREAGEDVDTLEALERLSQTMSSTRRTA